MPDPSVPPDDGVDQMLSATFNLGDEGDPVTVASNIGGDGLDDVVDVGGSLTFDDSRRGRGMAVRHEVGYRGNAYYGWDDSFSWSPIWFGRVYIDYIAERIGEHQ